MNSDINGLAISAPRAISGGLQIGMTLADLALDVGDRAIGRLRQATLFASKRELIKPIDKHRVLDDLSTHDQERAHHQLVFLSVPVRGGRTDHIVNKPPSGGFVVSAAS